MFSILSFTNLSVDLVCHSTMLCVHFLQFFLHFLRTPLNLGTVLGEIFRRLLDLSMLILYILLFDHLEVTGAAVL